MSRHRWSTATVAARRSVHPLPDEEFGPRLDQGPAVAKPRCALAEDHVEHGAPIRFVLRRYGRDLGTILICGNCRRELNPTDPRDFDPLTVAA